MLRTRVDSLAVCTLVLLAGCGGLFGHGSHAIAISDAQRTAVLDQIVRKFNSLPGLDADADNQELLKFLKGIPEISSSGISDDLCVWGQFTDGRELTIVNNLPPEPTRGRVAKTRAPTGLPVPNNVRLMSGLGTCYNGIPAGIENQLASGGYQVTVENASVDNFLTLKDNPPGVLYVTTHGGNSQGSKPYAIYTTTQQSTGNDAIYKELLDAHELRYMVAYSDRDASGVCMADKHYGITARFIHNNVRFGANSLVYINACSSNNTAFRNECLTSGAAVYAGWTKPTPETFSGDAAKFVIDRMLGANIFNPDLSLKHSIDYTAVKQDMHGRTPPLDLITFEGKQTELIFTPTAILGSDLGVLAPGIDSFNADRGARMLTLSGLFGKNPAPAGSVTVGGAPLAITSWNPTSIVCSLPDSSSGFIVVTVRGHKSNNAGPVPPSGAACIQDGTWIGDNQWIFSPSGTTQTRSMVLQISNGTFSFGQNPTNPYWTGALPALTGCSFAASAAANGQWGGVFGANLDISATLNADGTMNVSWIASGSIQGYITGSGTLAPQ